MAERKRRAAERATRRESLLVLLSRARRGVPLTPAEAALMFAHVEVELAEADELRRTVQGQQTAIQAAHDRTAAAEAAIVEAEAERLKADCLSACGTIADMHAAAVGEVRGPLLGVVEDVASVRHAFEAQRARADTLNRLCREQRQRAEQAEQRAADAERRHVEALAEQQHTERGDAAAIHLANSAATAWQQRAAEVERRLAGYEAVFGPDAVDDFHKMQHRAKQAEAERDELHATLGLAPGQLHDAAVSAIRGRGASIRELTQRAEAAERDLATLREGVRECGGDPTHVQNAYAQIRMWRNSAQRAERRADRYRLAWFAARRDRKADRAAMAAELPLVHAGQQARAIAATPCEPGTAGKGHPVHELLAALTREEPLDRTEAVDLTYRYYEAIHADYCPRLHRPRRPGRAAEANRAQLDRP
jgi:chromosome segregation ATPase